MRQSLLTVLVVLGCRGQSRLPEQFNLGRPATAADIAPIDIDVNPAGAGLPAGQGTYEEGAQVYAAKCASCHGANGEGNGPAPRLIGGSSARLSLRQGLQDSENHRQLLAI